MSDSSAPVPAPSSTAATASSPATRFLTAFNQIEGFLREELDARRSDSFTWMVRQLAKRGRLTRSQSDALHAFADLRNAISHGEYRDGRPIADPRPDVVAEISRLRDVLLAAPTVVGVLSQEKIIRFSPATTVNEVLSAIRENGYAQFPVYDDHGYHGLLTTRCVARWLAHDLADNGALDAGTVGDILRFTDHVDRAVLAARSTTVPEILEILGTRDAGGKLPEAVIVTEHGRRDQLPILIVVASDIPALLGAVEF
ncbi:CBS domain-containing protein [Corynebacterium pygosceleis]|uniref:CBS domain-containing protein n=1 Tax=Corynebacterium pygosceleis TaxID=2800406 RepID=A0A9Q4C773_9CORY|nr:CBS domain-containing protein [Corynebacterium pygosceleis]MCK7636941.1 CBS domain-containing protein [Corynebacterium pygosceleis]MCK7674415.1 CBS domain-containing protein [Corynebacterium pygosceleis]MCL0120287.1 CBS domain-containing protein [Corynebacterium pygosceleis]MCX7467694.1 CBS domain-containing protein [Corynebacterium pygosceleis]